MVGGFDHLVEDVAELRHRRLGIGLSSNDLISEDYDLFHGDLGREWRKLITESAKGELLQILKYLQWLHRSK